jgi:hypothetical protein
MKVYSAVKRAAVLLTVAALVCPSVVIVLADTTSGSIAVTGGSLSLTPAAVSMTGVTLDGTDHNNVPGTTSAWTADDPTGTGSGWHGTIVASNFSDGSGHSIAKSGFDIQLLDENIVLNSGNTKPTSQVTSFTNFASEITFVSAASGTGMGNYSLTPTFRLDVPAETHAGSYSCTITTTITSGP